MALTHLFPANSNPIVFSILAWYLFSLSISLYNKWMFGPDLGFEFPVIITSLHQMVLFILSGSCLLLTPQFRLAHDSKLSYSMPWQMYVRTILPCALASAADIGAGNSSFRFITLSLYTMVKSSSLVFVLLWGVAFKLETLSTRLVLIVAIMTGGVVMMVYGHDSKDGDNRPTHIFIGCSLVLISAVMSGLRWALTQLLLKRHSHTQNPILTIFYLSPAMSIALFITGGFLEGFGSFAASKVWDIKGVPVTLCLLVIPGILAFLMTLSEFILLSYASLLTLSIAGIFKELLTILLGHLVFGDSLSLINGVGLLITLLDILWYNYYRLTESSTVPTLTDVELEEVNE